MTETERLTAIVKDLRNPKSVKEAALRQLRTLVPAFPAYNGA